MATRFEILFGIPSESVQKNVLLFPLTPKGLLKSLGLDKLNRGRLYASANIPGITMIQTGMGAPLVGDAVLYLKETNCKNALLLGSCGALYSDEDLRLGAYVLPEKCLSFESFSEFLLDEGKARTFYPDTELIGDFSKFMRDCDLLRAVCATVSSLKLEEDRHDWLLEKKIDVVDMECSAFLAASSYAGISALAFFYVTDIVNERPFYEGSFFPLPEKILGRVLDFLRGRKS